MKELMEIIVGVSIAGGLALVWLAPLAAAALMSKARTVNGEVRQALQWEALQREDEQVRREVGDADDRALLEQSRVSEEWSI